MSFIKIFVCLIIPTMLLTSCKTPSTKKVTKTTTPTTFAPEVQYTISDKFDPNGISCIAVGPVSLRHDNDDFKTLNQTVIVRQALYGALSPKNFVDIEIALVDSAISKSKTSQGALQKLQCDAILTAEIHELRNQYFLTYSITSLDISVSLVDKNGDDIWSARHKASSHEGALPLSPFSIISGAFVAITNKQDEVALQVIDSAARRILKTLPNRTEPDYLAEILTDFHKEEPFQNKRQNNNSKSNIEISRKDDIPAFLAKGAFEEALKASYEAIEKHPDDGQNYYYAGRSLLMLNKNQEAIDYTLGAIARGYDTADSYSSLGLAYLKNKRLNLAAAAMQKARIVEPDSAYLSYNLGVIMEANASIEAAAEAYHDAAQLSLKTEDLGRLYRSFSSLQRLSKRSVVAKDYYLEIGEQLAQRYKP